MPSPRTSEILSPNIKLELAPPFNTKRLKPKDYVGKHFFLKLKENGEIVLFKGEVPEMVVSPDGMKIIFRRKITHTTTYSYEDLKRCGTKSQIEKFNYAAKYVLGLRRNTPKMTSFVMCESAACYLMENDPNPDFRMDFYDNGVKICFRHDQEKRIRIIEPRTESRTEGKFDYDEQNLPFFYLDKCKLLLKMKTEMLRREKLLKDNGFGYPNIDGRRPTRK